MTSIALPFGQTFETPDLLVVGLLVLLEGLLSIDNALVLGLLAKRLPHHLQAKALTYGLVGAFLFRLVAIATATYLLEWRVAKLLGGAYLVYVAGKHFYEKFTQKKNGTHVTADKDRQPVLVNGPGGTPVEGQKRAAEIRSRTPVPLSQQFTTEEISTHAKKFWMTVGVIELTDIAFAVDSIVAAIALVSGQAGNTGGRHPKLWVVYIGGMIGVVLMRFAAVLFIRLLEAFPRFETSAYLLVTTIGAKLVLDWQFNADHNHVVLDFHTFGTTAFWVFWATMLACFAIGFIPQRQSAPKAS